MSNMFYTSDGTNRHSHTTFNIILEITNGAIKLSQIHHCIIMITNKLGPNA